MCYKSYRKLKKRMNKRERCKIKRCWTRVGVGRKIHGVIITV